MARYSRGIIVLLASFTGAGFFFLLVSSIPSAASTSIMLVVRRLGICFVVVGILSLITSSLWPKQQQNLGMRWWLSGFLLSAGAFYIIALATSIIPRLDPLDGFLFLSTLSVCETFGWAVSMRIKEKVEGAQQRNTESTTET